MQNKFERLNRPQCMNGCALVVCFHSVTFHHTFWVPYLDLEIQWSLVAALRLDDIAWKAQIPIPENQNLSSLQSFDAVVAESLFTMCKSIAGFYFLKFNFNFFRKFSMRVFRFGGIMLNVCREHNGQFKLVFRHSSKHSE